MWVFFGSKCVKRATFCILQDYPWTDVNALIHLNENLQQFKQPIKAGHKISQNPNCFLCSLDSMLIDAHVPKCLKMKGPFVSICVCVGVFYVGMVHCLRNPQVRILVIF